jgi:hypothetical protein
MTFPVILGTGRRLFGETAGKTTWTLAESKIVGEGTPITIFKGRQVDSGDGRRHEVRADHGKPQSPRPPADRDAG